MQAAVSHRQQVKTKLPASHHSAPGGNSCEEIWAYIAARDLLFTQAEANPSQDVLLRLSIANVTVEKALRPARTPYQAQCLPEPQAQLQRRRCQAVKARLAQFTLGVTRAA